MENLKNPSMIMSSVTLLALLGGGWVSYNKNRELEIQMASLKAELNELRNAVMKTTKEKSAETRKLTENSKLLNQKIERFEELLERSGVSEKKSKKKVVRKNEDSDDEDDDSDIDFHDLIRSK